MRITSEISQFIARSTFDDIGGAALRNAKFTILDTIGSTLAALRTPVGESLAALASDEGDGNSTLWGTGTTTSLSLATFIHASLSQVLDFDDTQEILSLAIGHPGPGIVPVALTLGGKIHASGADVLRAIVLGYEFSMRFASAIAPDDSVNFSFSNSQILGSVVASCVLLGLDTKRTANAIGIATASCPVGATRAMWNFDARPMSWVKDSIGFVALGGLMAARMAKGGFRGSMRGLDPEDEYHRLCGSPTYDAASMTEGLGDSFRIENVSFKPYPTCRYIQSTLDLCRQLFTDNALKKDDIEEIFVRTTSFLARSFCDYEPSTCVDAQFSLPFAISRVLSDVPPSAAWYSAESLGRADAFPRKVRLLPDADIDRKKSEEKRLESIVTFLLRDGRTFSGTTSYAKGNVNNPFSEDDHYTKFSLNMMPQYSYQEISSIIKYIDNIHMISDINFIIDILK